MNVVLRCGSYQPNDKIQQGIIAQIRQINRKHYDWQYGCNYKYKYLRMFQKNSLQKKEFPTLQTIALNVVAKNYHLYPELQGLPQKFKEKIIEKSIEQSSPHDVLLTAPNIQQEKYWKKCCEIKYQHHSTINLENHGLSWKIAYLEKYLQIMLENIKNFRDPKENALIFETVKIISPWIFNLELKRMAPDIDIKTIALYLPNLMEIKLKYTEGSNVEYKKQTFGMKFAEAANLSEMILNSSNLISLHLPGNLIDDDLFKFLMQGISSNISLVELNLSHNKIGDQGARRISKYLIRNQILVNLNLSNNLIGYDGSRYIAQALKINKTLENLNLKLNTLDDKAGSKLFKDLVFNTKLKYLDIEANSLGSLTARKISLYTQNIYSLHLIQLGNNNFSEQNLQTIKLGINDPKLKQHFINSKYTELMLK